MGLTPNLHYIPLQQFSVLKIQTHHHEVLSWSQRSISLAYFSLALRLRAGGNSKSDQSLK